MRESHNKPRILVMYGIYNADDDINSLVAEIEGAKDLDDAHDKWWSSMNLGACAPYSVYVAPLEDYTIGEWL